MKTLIYLSVALTSVVLSACSGEKSSAQKAVVSNLKDPDSAKFGEFTRFGEDLACLGINAKNSLGGYTGEQQAMIIKKAGEWHVIAVQKITHQECIDFATKIEEIKLMIEQMRKSL